MNPSPRNEEDIFKIALAIPAGEVRLVYLHQACGDDHALRERVVALLKVAEEERSFLEQPAAGFASTAAGPPPVEQPGEQIGPYKLLQVIGDGGMGVVYMAEQKVPVSRRVALKVIKPGMDTRQVIARFEAERQALSMMDHPNIAKVLDAGATDAGRPYFVMELVKGQPITQYCDQHHLNTRERLDLFVPVCQAIQHAHQKGIIHRDLKPSNILVAEYDQQPVPKVIDFGVSKATSQSLTEKTMFTALGQIVGTLDYMSPEQAKVNQLDIDTRSDIYSLGVLLYELLTGTTPFDKQRLRSAAFDEMLRIIREEDPPRPSTRLSTIQALASVAASRKTNPDRLSGIIRGELDWIVMKALDKDRNRRYETASGLGTDIQRYLHDEPVEACPPSAAYRFRKLARRNKAAIATGAIVVAALVLGLTGTTWQAIRAVNAERVAHERAQAAFENAQTAEQQRSKAIAERDAKEKSLAEQAAQRQRADKERTRADEIALISEAVNDFLINDILKPFPHWGLSSQPVGVAPTLVEILERSAKRVGSRFQEQPLVEARVRSAIGCSLLEFGKSKEAAEQLEASVRLFRQANEDKDEAQGKTSGSSDPQLATTLVALGRAHLSADRPTDAEPLFRESLKISEKLGENNRFSLLILTDLASACRLQGKHAEAIELTEKVRDAHVIQLGADDPSTLTTVWYLALAYESANKHPQAIECFEQAASGFERRKFQDPFAPDAVRSLVEAYERIHQFEQAEAWRRKGLAVLKERFGAQSAEYVRELALLAFKLLQQSRWSETEPLLHECLAIREKIQPDEWSTFGTRSMLGGCLMSQGKFADAEPLLLSGYEGMKQREAKIPEPAKARLVEALDRLVELYTAIQKPDEATKWRAERAKYPPLATSATTSK